MEIPKSIGVDFDGTLCDLQYPGIGTVKQGAKEALIKLRELGYKIIIWTCRTCHYYYEEFGTDPSLHPYDRPAVKEMKEWLDANGIPYDEIDDSSRGKLHADYYIDDKAIRFEDNWPDIVKFIEDKEDKAWVCTWCGAEGFTKEQQALHCAQERKTHPLMGTPRFLVPPELPEPQ